jgi:hypothetical protein
MALRILIFSIAMVADYSFDMKNIDVWAPAFFKHNNSFIATVTGGLHCTGPSVSKQKLNFCCFFILKVI